MNRDEQIELIRPWMHRSEKVYEWPEAEATAYRAVGGFDQGRHDAMTARIEGLLDGPVAAMIAEAERRGAVKALRDAQGVYGTPGITVTSGYVQSWLKDRLEVIQAGDKP